MEVNRTQRAIIFLRDNHPIIFRKLTALYKINPNAQFTDDMVSKVGLTDDELRILRNFGIIKRVGG